MKTSKSSIKKNLKRQIKRKNAGCSPSFTHVFMLMAVVECFSVQPMTRELFQVVAQLMKHSRYAEYFTGDKGHRDWDTEQQQNE